MSFKEVLDQNRWLTDSYASADALYQIAYEFEEQQDRIDALERRIEEMERKLNHKEGEE